jgi:transcriptional regulator with XRE-family HTH domain
LSTSQTSERNRRGALAQFLRTRRERALPSEYGLQIAPRRRARGLLREEVALISGVGVTWYTWLEQGRAIAPSVTVLDNLARALRLDPVERAHLFRLARPDLEPVAAPHLARRLAAPLDSILAGLSPHAVYVSNTMWDVIAWNEPAKVLFGDFKRVPPEQRNLIYMLYCDAEWRDLFRDCPGIRETAVAQFRASTARLGNEPYFKSFIEMLSRASDEFRAQWRHQDVHPSTARSKILTHPKAGQLKLDYAIFRPDAEEDVRFTIYTPADKPSAARIAALAKRPRKTR